MSKAIVFLPRFWFFPRSYYGVRNLNHFSRTRRTKPWMWTKQLGGQRPPRVVRIPGNAERPFPTKQIAATSPRLGHERPQQPSPDGETWVPGNGPLSFHAERKVL